MAKVAREIVEKAGVNVDQLLELLVKNASAEFKRLITFMIFHAPGRHITVCIQILEIVSNVHPLNSTYLIRRNSWKNQNSTCRFWVIRFQN